VHPADTQASFADAMNAAAFFLTNSCTLNGTCPLSACSSRRFEPDAGTTADHDDGLPAEFRFALDGRSGGCGAHDSSDQQFKK
jgi:hypothetical protein